ncbi:MAG TPA: long-chain-fatty-acid--CoA ligase [Pseudonocardiaceae bacterium]|nr:long-chain-fatty-acid--CoA ligase [Pseudonocardiaceae bacterium]
MNGTPEDIADTVTYWRARKPDAEAMRCGALSWTWSELDERIRRNAAAQLAIGLVRGDRIVSFDKNHPFCLETSLAATLIGTTNAVVNFRLAPPEIAYIINDSQATVVLVGAEFVAVLAEIRADLPMVREVIVVGGDDDEYEAWLAANEPLRDNEPVDPEECFLQLYTSGTTGFPKGAMITQRGITAHANSMSEGIGVDDESVSMVAMPLFHVGGSSWALCTLYYGARQVLVREVNPPALLDELIDQGVTHTFLVPAIFGFLLQVPGVAERDYAKLRGLVYGASPMPLPLLRRSLATFPADFHQVYGMTEASGAVTILGPEQHKDKTNEHRLVSAGLPLEGVEIIAADPVTGEPLGPGEVGEIMVRTRQLMTGYWRNPQASEQTLTADGWLHSGDAGYLDEDGYLYISDRVKDMIISGGENVYPAEVERVLGEHPSVADVAVIGVPDEKWGEVGKAIVVAAPGATVDADELIALCRSQLAAFKCPKSIEVVSELPRNATGKILKRTLREPYWADRSRAV